MFMQKGVCVTKIQISRNNMKHVTQILTSQQYVGLVSYIPSCVDIGTAHLEGIFSIAQYYRRVSYVLILYIYMISYAHNRRRNTQAFDSTRSLSATCVAPDARTQTTVIIFRSHRAHEQNRIQIYGLVYSRTVPALLRGDQCRIN